MLPKFFFGRTGTTGTKMSVAEKMAVNSKPDEKQTGVKDIEVKKEALSWAVRFIQSEF